MMVLEINYSRCSLCQPHLTLAHFADVVESQGGPGINEYVAKQFDPSIRWEDVKWLMK